MSKILLNITLLALIVSVLSAQSVQPTAEELIKAIDANMSAENQVITSKMIVHGRRASRTIESRSWVVGNDLAFTE